MFRVGQFEGLEFCVVCVWVPRLEGPNLHVQPRLIFVRHGRLKATGGWSVDLLGQQDLKPGSMGARAP